jgi:hypothetical protein
MSSPMTGAPSHPPQVAGSPSEHEVSGLGPVGDWLSGDWPVQAADRIDSVIGSVRRKTTGPAIVASRAVVYGLACVPFAIAAVVLLLVALVRGLDVLLPTWTVHLILGAVLTAAGLFAWSRRVSKDDR